jgi:hypothetical protein
MLQGKRNPVLVVANQRRPSGALGRKDRRYGVFAVANFFRLVLSA